jgi:DNA primase
MAKDLQQLKEEIRSRTEILDVIGQYTTLKRAGKNWKGLCPFHADRNPSFNVQPEKQIYKCFSCGEGGDVFTFVQKKENLDFIEALEFLARRAGIPFEWEHTSPEHKSEREELLALNAMAVAYFQDRLAKSEDAKAYLNQRALLKSTQEQFEIGFAPPDWEGLTFYLQRKGANLAMAAKAGLIKVRQPEGNGYYDTFRNRLMFPIHDLNMRPIAFGGRAMGDDPAKYLNTEQTPLFDKSRTLYGLAFARKSLSETKPPIFVEGYIDVITAHQAGYTQCVATLGTSMTEEHGRILARYSPRVLICYDADSAGIKATLRGASVWESLGIENGEVRIVRLPEGDDPDSILKRGDGATFQKALDSAVPRADFQIDLALKNHTLDTAEARSEALKLILPILASLPNALDRDRYIQRYAYLHPAYSFQLNRAVSQITTEVDRLQQKARASASPREQGYPLTENTNRGAMREMPPYDASPKRTSQAKPGAAFPMTREVRRKGGCKDTPPILTDYTPPSTELPPRSRAQKAEDLLLRALFTAEWRTYLLTHITEEDFITANARLLWEQIARTPATNSGTIDTHQLLAQIEAEETQLPEEDPFQEEIDRLYMPQNAILRTDSAKLSYYLREILEESFAGIANDPMTEASVQDCIGQLRRHRLDREVREILQKLQSAENLSDAERQDLLRLYHQKMLERRGSTPQTEAK